jgi:hypothetical protein
MSDRLLPDLDSISTVLIGAVPFAGTLGLRFTSVTADEAGYAAEVVMPDSTPIHNHIGGPHAGALYSLGETATGAVVFAAFADLLGRAVPLVVRAEVSYRKVAMGEVHARATLTATAADGVRETANKGQRPEVPIPVEIYRADGEMAAALTVVWTLRLAS